MLRENTADNPENTPNTPHTIGRTNEALIKNLIISALEGSSSKGVKLYFLKKSAPLILKNGSTKLRNREHLEKQDGFMTDNEDIGRDIDLLIHPVIMTVAIIWHHGAF
jgi:hypothetical protein